MANRSEKQIKHTIEMGKMNKGKIRTFENKEKNRNAHLGKKHTKEWKDKISKNHSRYWLDKKDQKFQKKNVIYGKVEFQN